MDETERLLQERRGMAEFPPNDYGQIDVRREATEGSKLRMGEFLFELVLHFFFPVSVPLLSLVKGRLGLEMHCWAPTYRVHEALRKEWYPGPNNLVCLNYALWGLPHLVLFAAVVMFSAGYLPSDSPALIDLVFAMLFNLFGSAVRAFKYGYRPRAARARLIDHVARRHEELRAGWVYLPSEWAVFLIRLAAAQVELPLLSTVLFEDPGPDKRAPARDEIENMVHEPPPVERVVDEVGEGAEEGDSSPGRQRAAVLSRKQILMLEHTKRIAPELAALVRVRDDGLIEAPVLAVLLEIILPLQGVSRCQFKRSLGPTLYYLNKLSLPYLVLFAALPSLLRCAFLKDFWTRSYSPPEIITMSFAALTIGVEGTWLPWILLSTALVFKRRLTLMFALAKLMDGTHPCFWPLRVADRVDQVQLWDQMRKTLLFYGENYSKRAVATLALLLFAVILVKLIVIGMLAYTLLFDTKWSVRSEPVVPGFLALLPFAYAPYIIVTIYWGAEINEVEKEQLWQALNLRQRQVIRTREALMNECQPETNGRADVIAETLRNERRIECVQQTLDLVGKTIATQQRPVVLIGWGNNNGKGILPLSYMMMFSYIIQAALHCLFLAQCINFA